VPKTLAILDELNSSQSANIEVERKEEVVGGAALTMMWVLLRCGQITMNTETNDCIYSNDTTSHYQALSSILQQLLRNRSGNRDLCGDLLQHLTSISVESNPSHLLSTSANKICSFIRILLEMDRLIPDNRSISDRFSTVQVVDVLLNLVNTDIRVLEGTSASDFDRQLSLRRLRNFLRVLSLTSMDEIRWADLETRLSVLFRDDHFPRLSVDDFMELSLELRNIVSLPHMKDFFARNSVSIPIQLQRAEKERERLQVDEIFVDRIEGQYTTEVIVFHRQR
jgi:hypothetical protein